MRPGGLISNKASLVAYKKLASQLTQPLNVGFLTLVFHADRQGRNGNNNQPLPGVSEAVLSFKRSAEAAGVLYAPEQPVLTGNDLIAVGFVGEQIGSALEKAYEAQITKSIRNKAQLIQIALQ